MGLPTEHLASGHIEELAKPTYSTCLGLILKGYDDYEHNRKQFTDAFHKIDVPADLMQPMVDETIASETEVNTGARSRGMLNFWSRFKDGIIDMFREEEDHRL